MQASGRYFISYVDRKKLSKQAFEFLSVGTEVTTFGDQPLRDVARELVPKRYTEPTPTEWRMAELRLTNRQRATGDQVPRGEAALGIVIGQDKEGKNIVEQRTFYWEYTPELLPANAPIRNTTFDAKNNSNNRFAVGAPKVISEPESPAVIGGKISYVPKLGFPFGGHSGKNFDSQIFRLPKGQMIGFIRIPTFEVSNVAEAADEFGEHMQSLDERSDALVIDLTRNGGGALHYMYAILSHLSPHPIVPLQQQIMISGDMAAASADRLVKAPFITTEEDAKKYIELEGLQTDFNIFQGLVNNDRFLLDEYKAGRRLSRPTYFWGMKEIPVSPNHFTKPILVLVDELDFSCADLFPAILQDNTRATIFGVRTAGAGGAVKETRFSNQFNIAALRYTWTLAYRKDGKPLENFGVTPDVNYEIKAEDLQGGFESYRNAVVDVLEKMVPRP
jgi:hypothetical protein